MRTNVDNFSVCSNIPAGIFLGTEFFACDNVIYAIHEGQRMRFEELPSKEKRQFLDEYLMDKEGQRFIRNTFRIVGFESGFKKWLFCFFFFLDSIFVFFDNLWMSYTNSNKFRDIHVCI